VSDTVPNPDRPVISRRLAAQAIMNYFLANADAGNHAANDELVAELARRQREARQHNDRR
jgi:predicted transcriptional regulator